MKVTRDVIYDLLPGYFSGDISPDTRLLVEEFLDQDPEFRRMMERFRAVFSEVRPASARGPVSDSESFERARSWLQKRSELRGYAIAFGLAALFVLILALRAIEVSGNPGPWVIALAFFATSAIAGYQLYRLKTQGPGRSRP
jgi:anti-sigma factor RsiW